MFEAVIFDWDGTLAHTRRAVVASFQKALTEVNCKISNDFIEQRIGIGSAETFREILRSCKIGFDVALIKRLIKAKIRNEVELSDDVNLFDGALQLLQSLRGKTKLGLASMNDRAIINHLLKKTNTQRFFAAVVTADDVVNPKPHPEIFLKCAHKLKSSPAKCVVVEDSSFGVVAAKKAKIKCIAVLTGVHSRKLLEKAGADLFVDSLMEKREILKFIFQ